MSRAFAKAIIGSAALLAAQPVPVLAQSARSISATDKAQGAQAHPQLLAEFGGAYTGPQTAFVTRVGQRVAVQSGLSNSERDFTVTLLDSPVVNAFAIPGGYVYVTRQLLALMNSEAELASVLGHEVGHVAARHSAKRSTRSALGQVLAAGIGAVTGSDIAGRVAGYGTQLYSLSFSRAQEYDADGLGVKYITAAGYDPYAAAGMLTALDSETRLQGQISGQGGSVPTWVSTHPNGADRIRRAEALARASGQPEPSPVQDTAFLRMLDGLAYDGPAKGVTGTAATRRVLRIVTVRKGDTVASLSSRMAYPDYQQDRFLVLNGIDGDADLAPGMLVKVVSAR